MPQLEQNTAPPVSRLLRKKEVQERTGLPISSLYHKIANGAFPRPVRIGARSVAWREADIDAWIVARPNTCGQGEAGA